MPARTRPRRTILMTAVVALVAAGSCSSPSNGASSTTTPGSPAASAPARPDTRGPVVLLVHGFAPTAEGYDCRAYWGKLEGAFTRWMPEIRLVTVAYESGDRGCDARIGTDTPDTSIGAIGRQLAAHVFRHYSSDGVPVLLLGHSMGGLVIRAALAAAGTGNDRAQYLVVPRIVTAASPHGGAAAARTCLQIEQCREQEPGSEFLEHLDGHPEGRGGTVWIAFGASGDELVPAASAVGLPADRRIVFESPDYTHISILLDDSDMLDARWRVVGADGSTVVGHRPRALRAMFLALTAPGGTG